MIVLVFRNLLFFIIILIIIFRFLECLPTYATAEWMGKWQTFNGSQIMVCRQKEATLSWTAARDLCKGMQADLIDLAKPGRTLLIANVISVSDCESR